MQHLFLVGFVLFSDTTRTFLLTGALVVDEHREPDAFLEEWRKFVAVQQNQTARFGQEFPVDERLYVNLRRCSLSLQTAPAISAHTVKVNDIGIYAEIGHGTTFCRPGISLVRRQNDTVDLRKDAQVFKSQCLNSMQTQSQNPSLAKIMKLMGANLEVFESNVRHSNLQSWARHVIRMIKRAPNYQRRWKFILIIPNSFDVRVGHGYHLLADEILQTIQLLNGELPELTMVALVRNGDLRFVRELGQNHFFCEKMQRLWTVDDDKIAGAWTTLENRIKRNYMGERFYVHVMDVLDGARPVYYEREADVSAVDVDCQHFSARGLSLLHVHIWNHLVQPSREPRWKPLVRPPYCPRPECPYMLTEENGRYCLRPKEFVVRDPVKPMRLMTGLFIGLTVVLMLILIIYTALL